MSRISCFFGVIVSVMAGGWTLIAGAQTDPSRTVGRPRPAAPHAPASSSASAGGVGANSIAPDFRDVAAAAGLTARTVIGEAATKDYILETTGGGVAILDYDADGWPDIFLVNGARRPAGTASASAGTGTVSPNQQFGSLPTGSPTSHLYRNNGGDGTFTDVTAKAGLVRGGWGQGVCAGDFDNDGHVDLFVTYYGDRVLYRNNGNGTFTDVTSRSGLAAAAPRWNTGAAFLDYDRDGHLDLFVSAYVAYEDATRYPPGSRKDCFWKGLPVMCGPQGLAGSHNALFRGNGDGTFTDVSETAGLLKTRPAFGFTPLVLDYDNDGWPDVYVANDSTASWLFHNNRDGTFREAGLQAGVALTADGRAQAGMGVSAADYDRDGWLDLVKTNFDDDTTSLYRNLGDGAGGGMGKAGPVMFEDATFASGLGVNTRYLGWGTGFFDADLDGWPDLLTVNGHVYPEADRIGGHYSYAQRKVFYRNLGKGRFQDVSTQAGPGLQVKTAARGAAFADLFNTGQQDIVINNMHGEPSLLHDCAAVPRHALILQLAGTKSNRSAIGARVTVHVAGGRQVIDEVRSGGSFCSQNDLRIHVGLGDSRRADRIEITWPNGAKEVVAGVDGNQLVVIREGAGVVRQEALARAKDGTRRRLSACASRNPDRGDAW